MRIAVHLAGDGWKTVVEIPGFSFENETNPSPRLAARVLELPLFSLRSDGGRG